MTLLTFDRTQRREVKGKARRNKPDDTPPELARAITDLRTLYEDHRSAFHTVSYLVDRVLFDFHGEQKGGA